MELGRVIALVAASALAVLACDKPDPAALDHADLKRAASADGALDRALKLADDAERTGHGDEAADILKRTAFPAADESVRVAESVAPRTVWGRTEKDALVLLAHDRKIEVGHYERALRGDDMDDKVAAIQKQLDLERRASTVIQDIDRGP